MPSLISILILAALTSPALAVSIPKQNSDIVNLRVEGLTSTIFEGPIRSTPRNITTPSGGTHLCDGTNLGANPSPGPTCTGALDAAAHLKNFPYDGTFDEDFQDFFITSIGTSAQTATQFWGLLLNFQFTPVGGCQQETKDKDEVLWAFDAFNKNYFLKLTGPRTARTGKAFNVTVTNGRTGILVAGASVGGVLSDANGIAAITSKEFLGVLSLKAERDDAIRSNRLDVLVLP